MTAGHPHETARDLMSAGVECIAAHETLDRAAQMMRDRGVGALPICGSDDRLKGIITDRDIVTKCIAEGHDPSRVTAGDLATGLVWVPADATVEEALSRHTMPGLNRGLIANRVSYALGLTGPSLSVDTA
ncbi:CBS domain-containing protein, partial [Nonomuraea sp. NPDC055795]